MKRSWISILSVVALLGLLALLATLQYRWLGQISSAEGERLQKRLETDTQRFAEDFNREIQTAYFAFQLPPEMWRGKNFAEFNSRYQIWRNNASFPALIKDFYFIENDQLTRYDFNAQTFAAAEWTDEFAPIRNSIQNGREPELISEQNLVLTMPVYDIRSGIFIRRSSEPLQVQPNEMPIKLGFLLIKLDETVAKNEILQTLVQKYFSSRETANYRLSVASQKDESRIVFRSSENFEISKNSADASAPLFTLKPGNFMFLINSPLLSSIRGAAEKQEVAIGEQFEKRVLQPKDPAVQKPKKIEIHRLETVNPLARAPIIRRAEMRENGGLWLLNVQHADGSLENFIGNTRRKNLAISFGILSLLATSIILVFVSSRRAQILAQRQLDFVSAVSHEFRTPLAVIYSAGENLTDGVIRSEKQMSQYGSLIKREGKKLSAMVEQILEFAGARSGQKKYELREADVQAIIESALDDCQSLINEKGFTVETEIAENLPKISGDANALSHAVQNLITNAIKYGGNHQWLKISARNGGVLVKIAVEDQGIGIDPKDMSKVFLPFYRAKSVVDAQIHGNGLGLSLVKQTAEAHGGKVFAESKPGQGSKFTIHLPVKK